MSTGKVYLVGAGPGDPELITVKGLRFLAQAEVVVYDYLANEELLAHAPQGAERIYVGKRGGVHHACSQEEINAILVDKAAAGRQVVRLKGGDPFIFGRGGEEIEALVAAGIPFEVVPGVTAAVAAATYAGIPITHRGCTSTVAFVTGHEDPTKPDSQIAWDKLATGIGTLVFFMGIKNLSSIMARLEANGRDPATPVAVVRWASTPEQQTVVGTIRDISDRVREAGLRPPAIIVVGEVVSLRDRINWFERRPLFGKRIAVTRSRAQASELVRQLEELGASCFACPTIEMRPPASWQELDTELDQVSSYDWLVFTSANGVELFMSRLLERGQDVRSLAGPRIAAVGEKTGQALAQRGLRPDLIPEVFQGEGLVASFVGQGIAGQRFLIPRAQEAREVLPEALVAAGAQVRLVPVYRNVRPQGQEEELRRRLAGKQIDLVTFTSSSTVRNFLAMLQPAGPDELAQLMAGVQVASIGPVTSATARQAGLPVHIEPPQATIEALVACIVRHQLGEDSGG
ncbi:MAG: uroporphyrinogen-III C-methyltransferase [Thermodesulfobacteriota bacterium]